MKLIYDEIKDLRLKELIEINSKDEVLIYEGRRHEDGLIKTRPYVKITEITTVSNKFKKMVDFLNIKKLDPSPLSNLDFTIIKENMLEGKVCEMILFLNEKLYWLAFRIERSIEYSPTSDKLPDDVSRDLIFIVKEIDDILKIPEGTPNGSIIYTKEYAYITI